MTFQPGRIIFNHGFLYNRFRKAAAARVSRQFSTGRSCEADQGELSTAFNAGPLAIYIHIPFCSMHCSYCVFKKTTDDSLVEPYLEALQKEIQLYSMLPGADKVTVSSVYIGGGTPSLLPPGSLKKVIDRIRDVFRTAEKLPVTMEGNPESLNPADCPAYTEAGISRLSIGVQSLDDLLLEKMNRRHTAREALSVIKSFTEAGFTDLSADMIYGVQGQTIDDLLKQARQLTATGISHLSFYPMVTRDDVPVPYRIRRSMYSELLGCLTDAGFTRYTTDDFSRSNNNRNRYELDAFKFPGGESIGLGAGAFGSVSGCFTANLGSVKKYIRSLDEGRRPLSYSIEKTPGRSCLQKFILGLKYLKIKKSDLEYHCPGALADPLKKIIRLFRLLGILTENDEEISLTEDGSFIFADIWSEIVLAATRWDRSR